MLFPDVTEILDDPEVGGGVAFQVIRTTNTRKINGVTQSKETFQATGNIQPAGKQTQASTPEDLLSEEIVIRSTFVFQTGVNNGNTFLGPDEVIYQGETWRITKVDNWSEWGFTTAYATKVMG